MGVVKNLMVRVGADLSGFISGFNKAAGTTGNFKKKTEQAMKDSALSMGNLKKAMAQGGKNTAIVSLVDQIRELEAEQKALKDAGFSWGYEGFEGNEMLLRGLKSELRDYISSLEDADDATEDTVRKSGKLGSAFRSAGSWIKNAGSRILSFGKHSKGSAGNIESLVRSIRRIGLVSVGLRLTKAVFGELQSIVTQYVSQNTALQAQVTALKSSLGQALAPAINLVTNALSVLMPYVVGVSNAIGSLITNLFGSGWTSVADGANAAASAIGGAGNAQKEFNRTLAGFDEITKLGSENSGGGGGGVSSTTTAVEGRTPAWLTSLSTQIKQAVGEGDFFGVGAAIASSVNTGIDSINISDTSLGSKIAGAINAGVQGATGFVETLDWSGLGDGISKNISGLIGGIDWSGVFRLLGSTAGGIGTAVWSAISDGVTSTFDFFRENIEQCGGDILAGILLGIGKAIVNVGSWIKENIFTPFVEGFKNVFKIHSPSDHEKITSLGENIMKGIFNGITDALSDPVGWIKEHVFTPLADGFKKVFGEDGFFSNLFSGGESGNVSVSVDAEAKLTTWKDKLKNKVVDFQSKLTTWKDNLKNKTVDFKSKLTTWQDSLRNKIVDFQSRLTTWKDSLSNKVVSFQSNLTTWKDSLKDKSVTFQSNLTTWKDSLKEKSVTFQSNLTSWKDSLKEKSVNFKSNLTTWKDSLAGKAVSFQARLTSWKDNLIGKSVNFQSKLTTWQDSLSGKSVMFQANLISWIDSLQNKWLEFKASVKQGWLGSLAEALGISEIWASLKLKLPKISVGWATAELGGVSIPYPSFSIKWNAKGGILDGAQIFGRAGNTLLGGGEAGREAILPLDRNTWWMDKVADRIALRITGGQSGDQSITINLVLDGKIIASTVVRNINAQARATGRNPLADYI